MTPSHIMLFWSLGGLAVFLVLALLPWVQIDSLALFRDFSALVLAFLSGTLWLPAVRDADRRNGPAMGVAMALFVLAWASFFLPYWIGILVLTLAYPVHWWRERRWFGAEQSLDYRNLRTLLTACVVGTHVLALTALTRTLS